MYKTAVRGIGEQEEFFEKFLKAVGHDMTVVKLVGED